MKIFPYIVSIFVPLTDLLHSPEEEHSFGFHDRPDEGFGGGGGSGGGLAPITDEGSEWTNNRFDSSIHDSPYLISLTCLLAQELYSK